MNTAQKSTIEISLFELVYGRIPFTALKNHFSWPKELPEPFHVFLAPVGELRDAARQKEMGK
jgi:hypothetical protein